MEEALYIGRVVKALHVIPPEHLLLWILPELLGVPPPGPVVVGEPGPVWPPSPATMLTVSVHIMGPRMNTQQCHYCVNYCLVMNRLHYFLCLIWPLSVFHIQGLYTTPLGIKCYTVWYGARHWLRMLQCARCYFRPQLACCIHANCNTNCIVWGWLTEIHRILRMQHLVLGGIMFQHDSDNATEQHTVTQSAGKPPY